MSSYSFSKIAIKDLDDICTFIGQINPKAASKLFDTIRQKCKLVASFPNMGKNYTWIAANLHGFTIDDYIVFYYPRTDGIDIIRVISGKRDLESIFEEFKDENGI
jgi:toxin ParE1/3/4